MNIKKLIPILVVAPAIFLALTPPWEITLDCTINSLFFLWVTFFSGFLAFAFLYQRVSVWLKLLVVWAFIVGFISRAPYMSFTMYWSVIACAYYYALCKRVEDWTLIKKAAQSLFLFITLLIIMQLLGKDTLLNFNQKDAVVLGTMGNFMMLGTYVCILAPFVIVTALNWIPLILIAYISQSSGTLAAVLAGFSLWVWIKHPKFKLLIPIGVAAVLGFGIATHDFDSNVINAGRLPVWKRTIQITNRRPLGNGLGTFKILFPILSQDLESSKATTGTWKYENTKGQGLAWRRTHNSWLQILFEVGYPGFLFFMLWIGSIFRNVWNVRNTLKLVGLTIISVVAVFHFPDRLTQSVLLILMFLAYCEQKEQKEKNGNLRDSKSSIGVTGCKANNFPDTID